MGQFVAIEKPESVSYDRVHELLYAAHNENRDKGLIVNTANMTGEELERHIGPSGKCFVVMDGDILAGVIAVRDIQKNTWYAKGLVLDQILVGVSPDYKGKHISTILHQKVVEYATEHRYSSIESRVAQENVLKQNIDIHWGFCYVDFLCLGSTDHYTTVLYKWIVERPYSEKYCKIRFRIRRFLIRLRYKPGKIKRFGI